MISSNIFLVTGGAGFIGANLVRHLLHEGARVRVLDDFSTGRWENLAEVSNDIEVVEADVRDSRIVRRAVTGTRGIFHLAALPAAVPQKDEIRMLDVNVRGTLCALMAARHARIPLVFASSAAVYGTRDAYLLHEKMPPEPRTQLGTQKLAGENYCRLFAETHGTRTIVLRLFNVLGPWENGAAPHAGVVARFAHALVRGQAPVLFGDGSQTRDFVYVSNVCSAMTRAIRAIDASGEVVNVGNGEGLALNMLYNQLAELAGVKRAPRHAPARPGELRHVRAALGHATSVLKYAPDVRTREGLRKTIEWQRERATKEGKTHWFTPADAPEIALEDPDTEDDEIPIYEAEEVIA
jgi:UDP-glucose 4-epimerase